MSSLRKRSLFSVWAAFMFFGAVTNAYRILVVEQPVGYYVTTPTSWLYVIPQTLIFNMPDMVSAGIYVAILRYSNRKLNEGNHLDNNHENGGADANNGGEYFQGIYVGPTSAPSTSNEILPSVSSTLPTLPGQVSGKKAQMCVKVFSPY